MSPALAEAAMEGRLPRGFCIKHARRACSGALDSDPTNNRPKNLRALCQRCHMLHDRPHHLAQRWITCRRRLAVGDLFLGPYPALKAPRAIVMKNDVGNTSPITRARPVIEATGSMSPEKWSGRRSRSCAEFCGLRLAGEFRRRTRENGGFGSQTATRLANRLKLRGFPETAAVCRDWMVGDAGIKLMAIAAWHPFKTRRRVADFVRETI